MKKCDFFENIKLFVFSPEELSEEEQKGIKEHLKRCSSCNKELATLNSIIEIKNKEKIDFPDEQFFEKLPDHIIEHINNAKSSTLNRISLLKPAVAFAVVIVLVISYFSFMNENADMNLDVYFYDMWQAANIDENSFYFDDFAYDFSNVDTNYFETSFTDEDISLIEKNLDKINILEDE